MGDTQEGLTLEDFGSPRYVAEGTIGAGEATVSMDLEKARLVGLYIPTGWVTGEVSLRVSRDGSTWFDLLEESGSALWAREVDTSTRGVYVPVPRYSLRGSRHVMLVSEETQTAAVVIGFDLGEA